MELVYQLSHCERGAMIAPAGCGKTHIISEALALPRETGRELVLTHTHAGVDALKRRMKRIGVSSSRYRVDTIAGWSLRLTSAFPKKANLRFATPQSQAEYKLVYEAAARLLTSPHIREIIVASYSGVYVDEYQDCSVFQHQIVLGLAKILPCRVLGDPLQRIFDFGQNETIDWEEHVLPHFTALPELSHPWRWKGRNEELGGWLLQQRSKLEAREPLDLSSAPIRVLSTSVSELTSLCWELARKQETIVVIRSVNQRCHALARRMKGQFSCVEPIDSRELAKLALVLDSTEGSQVVVSLIDFACSCATKLKSELKTIKSAFLKGRTPNVRKHKNVLSALQEVAKKTTPSALRLALSEILSIDGVSIYRRELLQEMERAFEHRMQSGSTTYTESVIATRNHTRHIGRRLPMRSMGTTLLVKGLEFDHAVVVDPTDLDANDLYVAITRGAKSLTIVSDKRVLEYKNANLSCEAYR